MIHVLTNLLDNAIKYQPQGGDIDISTSWERDKVRLRVRDHGVGVAPELLGEIFECFVRSPNASQDNHGTGLGLPITRQLVELHRGRIRAEPADGGGTAFRVELPIRPTTPALVEEE